MFDRAYKSLRNSARAINELDDILVEYFESSPFQKVTDIDMEVERKTIKLVRTKSFPQEEVDRKITEAVSELKNCFDQLSYEASAQVDPSVRKKKKLVNFPWSDTRCNFAERFSGDKCKIPSDLYDLYLRAKPFGTGSPKATADDICRSVAALANLKHTIGIEASTVITELAISGSGTFYGGDDCQYPGPALLGKPVGDEIVLIRTTLDTTLDLEIKTNLSIGFKDFPRLAGQNALHCLHLSHEKARHTLELFEEELSAS